jgi:hypothetical protein
MPNLKSSDQIRGGARVAEWARLLSECRGNLVAGSNPALPATGTRLSLQACFLFCLVARLYKRIYFKFNFIPKCVPLNPNRS